LAIGSITSNLNIRNTSSQKIKLNGYSFAIKPDCVACRKGDVGVTGTDLASIEFFIEFKMSRNADPFHSTKQSAKGSEECDKGPPMPLNQSPAQQSAEASDAGQRKAFNQSSEANKTMAQIGTYIAIQTDSQYRTHTFFVLIIGEYARLMRWDRSGIIFTDPIYYNQHSELVEFFERYDTALPEVRGSDKFVGQASPEEISAALAMPEFDAVTPLLAVSIQNKDHPEHPNRYIIGSPEARPSLPIGRSTRTAIAYDVRRKKIVFMKDSWPVFLHDNMMEGRVYKQLHDSAVRNTPLCVDFTHGDEQNHETRTQCFTPRPGGPKTSIPVRRHHRLILDTVGKPLAKFASSRELVKAVRAAIIGMNLKRFASASH